MTPSATQASQAAIPTCPHTGITLPECSCPSCLRSMLERVGFHAVATPVAKAK
jgi:hypothetical protein